MSYKLFVTDPFRKHVKRLAKKYPSLRSDLAKLIKSLEKKPTLGISLGKDCYKIRMLITSKGRGKSGGARVITCVKRSAETIYLLSIYDKSQQEGMSDKDLDDLIKLAGL